MPGDLLSVKELAAALKKHPSYVYSMKAHGFRMVSRLTTLNAALRWLARHPNPRGRRHEPNGALNPR
jgi:hypothetical protein